jgi:hypothetical protein
MQVEVTRRWIDEGQVAGPSLPVVPARCDRCELAHLVPADAASGPCPSCGRGTLAPSGVELVGGAGGEVLPERVVPFTLDEDAALRALAEHVAEGGWFLRGDLSPEALRRNLRRVWWPEWLVDADVNGVFSLEVGFDYQVKSNKERYDGTSWVSFEEVDTRIRWEPRVGRIQRRLHDVAAVALTEQAAWSARVGQTDRSDARAFRTTDLDGAVVRLPTLPPDAAWSQAVPVLTTAAGALAQGGAQAEHQRDLSLTATWTGLHWTWQLLPVWTTSYDDGAGQRWLLVVNGRTGRVTGARLKNTTTLWLVWGTLAALGFGSALLGALLFAIGIPLLAVAVGAVLFVIGIAMFVLGLLVGIFAAIPLFSGLSWNRAERAVQPTE